MLPISGLEPGCRRGLSGLPGSGSGKTSTIRSYQVGEAQSLQSPLRHRVTGQVGKENETAFRFDSYSRRPTTRGWGNELLCLQQATEFPQESSQPDTPLLRKRDRGARQNSW